MWGRYMWKCPHCDKEIQEEAIFCRHCRRDVEPPLWLADMQRCPFCAEWIEVGTDICQFCDKNLSVKPTPKIPPFIQEPSSDFVSDIRDQILMPDTPPDKPPSKARRSPPKPSPDIFEETAPLPTGLSPTDDGGTSLRRNLLDQRKRFSGFGSISPSQIDTETDGKGLLKVLPTLIRRIIPVVLGGVIVIAIVYLVMGPGRDFLNQMVTSTPASTPRPAPSSTFTSVAVTVTPRVEVTDTPHIVAPPIATPSCVLWDQVSVDDADTVMCVYGEVKRWYSDAGIDFIALFSEEMGTFVFIDHTRTYPEVKPGTCVMAEGYIELMRGVRPYIDLAGTLEFCSEDLQGTP